MVLLTLAFGLAAGCAPGDQGTAAGQPTTSAAAPATSAPEDTATPPPSGEPVKTIRVSVRDGKASPPPDRVAVPAGQRVKIVVTSDVADEVHLHGYDKEVELRPGKPGSVEFTADQPGLYEVETHESGTLLFQLLVKA